MKKNEYLPKNIRRRLATIITDHLMGRRGYETKAQTVRHIAATMQTWNANAIRIYDAMIRA